MTRRQTPDDTERDSVETAPLPWDEDDFDDPLDTRPEEEDEEPEDYTWPGEGVGEGE